MYMTDKWEGQEHFNIKRFKYLEFYVGNAKQVVHFYRSAFGFTPYAYCGPETGVYSHVSYVLKNRKIFFVFTTPLKSSHPASNWLKKHGNPYVAVGFDPEGRASLEWGVSGVPETFIINARGIITYKHVGPITEKILTETILPKIQEAKR